VSTTDFDADTPPLAPDILLCNSVTWKFVVSNTGDVGLVDVDVAYSNGVTVTYQQTSLAVDGNITT
jgi:hypothetical protein